MSEPSASDTFSDGGTLPPAPAPPPSATAPTQSVPPPAALSSSTSPARAASGAFAAATLPSLEASGYEVLAEIGKGGMGVVHRARQKSLGREVAVKRIKPGRASADARDRFVAEAAVTGLLDHPNVVPVHDLGRTADGDVFIAMKLVDGTAWKDLLHPSTEAHRALAARLDRTAHLRILLAVCNAVAFAHRLRIVHRDLKPENVMVGEFGEVLVMDWGIALDLRAAASEGKGPDSSGRASASPAGTPAYMPPEMADGRTADIGPATDVFLLGAILHEIVTGAAPYSLPTLMAVLLAASKCEPPRYGPGVPDSLAAICRRAMAREPAARFPSATAFQEALEGYLRHRESMAIADAASAILDRCAAEGGSGPGDGSLPAARRSEAFRNRLYAGFAEAVAGFRQARLLWKENPAAEAGERRARAAYAEAALAAGDLGLAAAQAAEVPGEEGKGLSARVAAAEAERALAARSARRARAGLIVAVLAIVVGLTVGIALIRASERRTAQALDEILRLADVKRLADYQAQASELWPAVPENVPAMRAWLERAAALRERLPLHRARLEELRARARPYDAAAQEKDRAAHPRMGQLLALGAERAEKERRLAAAGDDEEKKELAKDLERIRKRAAELEQAVRARRAYEFADGETRWEHDTVAALVKGLEALGVPGPVGDTIEGVRARMAFAETVRERSIDSRRELWARTIDEIARSPRYGGLRIEPQLGLVPVGADPASGLHELAHLETGAVPERGKDGALRMTEESGIVFVLLPGGAFRQGAVKPEGAASDETNRDPDALDDEAPVAPVTLAPFLLAKHEMTQGQWLRASGSNPSQYGPGTDYGGKVVTLQNPLENVSQEEATAVLKRLSLALPTEAQWEYGARGGTTTPYWTGATKETLAGAANVADRFAEGNGGVATGAYELWLDDGHRVHAPAGTYRANGFGLCDMTGNVLEWCKDAYGSYRNRAREGDGERVGDGEGTFVHRGGNWFNTATSCRSAIRDADSPESKWDSLGFRAARRLSGAAR